MTLSVSKSRVVNVSSATVIRNHTFRQYNALQTIQINYRREDWEL